MQLLGKCPPEPTELADAADAGFTAVELYLEHHHIDNIDQTLTAIDNTNISIQSVHTPHVTNTELDYITNTDTLADTLNAKLVIHSSWIGWGSLDIVTQLDLDAAYSFENQPGYSHSYMRRVCFEQNHAITYDTAHAALAYDHDTERLASFIQANTDNIDVIHLTDATACHDGVPFSDGLLDHQLLVHSIDQHYEGLVVLEVPRADQRTELERTLELLEH